MKYDQETLEAVIAARHLAMQANNRAAHNPGDPQAMQQLENAEAVLAGALGRLRMLSDTYPHLKTDRPMTQYVEKLTLIENRIAFARQAFNEAVMLYNARREAFPSNLIASLCNFRAANLLEEVAPEVIPTLEFRLPFA
jgi:LemA protein